MRWQPLASALLLACLHLVPCNTLSDAEALLAFKAGITNWEELRVACRLDGWNATAPVCQWSYVACNGDGRVAKLDFGRVQSKAAKYWQGVVPRGTLAPELGNIGTLEELRLHEFDFGRGGLPPSWASKLRNLAFLELMECNISGTIPPQWTQGTQQPLGPPFPSLTSLELARNSISGTLPDTWGRTLPSLQVLDLSNNKLTGPLPASWGAPDAFQSLTNLSLSMNELEGVVPESWGVPGAFRNIKAMKLSTLPGVCGVIPPSLEGPVCSWSGSGCVPGVGTGGWVLNSDCNRKTGMPDASLLPPPGAEPSGGGGVGEPGDDIDDPSTTLEELQPNMTVETTDPVVGALLAQKAAILNWETEFAMENDVQGWNNYMQLDVCNWTGVTCNQEGSVTRISLQRESTPSTDNNLPGSSLAPELANISTLEIIQLRGFNLSSGGLPSEWAGALSNMTNIELEGSYITGPIPDSWAQPGAFPKLRVMKLGDNRLSGLLPESWGRVFPALTVLDVSQNQLQGGLTNYDGWGAGGSMQQLQELYLNNNLFGGPLPEAWGANGTFPALVNMSLSGNPIQGSLQHSWGVQGSFPQLKYLYLFDCMLSGPIPQAWGNASFTGPNPFPKLQAMDLNSNPGLCGEVPASVDAAVCDQVGYNPCKRTRVGSNVRLFQQECDGGGNSTDPPAPPPPEPVYDGGSSVPVAAIVGGVAGGIAFLAALSFLALRPHKGWLRRRIAVVDGKVKLKQKPQSGSGGGGGSGSSQQEGDAEADAEVGLGTSSSGGTGSGSGSIAGTGSSGGASLAQQAQQQQQLRSKQGGQGQQQQQQGEGVDPGQNPKLLQSQVSRDSAFFSASLKQQGSGSQHPPGSSPGSGSGSLGVGLGVGVDRTSPFSTDGSGGRLTASLLGLGDPLTPTATGSSESTIATAGGMEEAGGSIHDQDPALAFIASQLPSLRQQLSGASTLSGVGSGGTGGAAAVGSGGTPGGGSGSVALSGASSSSLAAEVQQWEVAWEDLRLERLIGKGSFGRVYLAQWRETPVAAKLLLNMEEVSEDGKLELPEKVMRQLHVEAAVLLRMRHPNIVTFLGLCPLPPCIVTEFCSRGSLYDVLRRASRTPSLAEQLTWKLRLRMALDAARGLLYLHKHSPAIIHRDVKSPNLLVDEHWRVKVTDFNLSKILAPHSGSVANSSIATNPVWLAPEVLAGERPIAASDVYSLGLVLFELLTWKLPWGAGESNVQHFQIMFQVTQGVRPEVPPREQLPGPDTASFAGLDAYCQLMRECWAAGPLDRPTFEEVVPRLKGLLAELSPSRANSARPSSFGFSRQPTQ